MGINVRQMLVPSSNYKFKCPNKMIPEYITIHNTYNDASAENEVRYMIHNTNQTSFHFAVDDKEVIQGVTLDRNAWHTGDGSGNGNRKSIGIEICYSKSGGTKYYQAEGLAIQFVAQLLHERGWGMERVKKHEDWSGKHCPHRILDEGRWDQFLNSIKTELERLNKPMKLFSFYTGGYSGDNLVEVHNYVKANKWDYSLEKNTAGDIVFTVGVFGEGTEAAVRFENWLTDRGFAFQKNYN
jgi:hypothetical protein